MASKFSSPIKDKQKMSQAILVHRPPHITVWQHSNFKYFWYLLLLLRPNCLLKIVLRIIYFNFKMLIKSVFCTIYFTIIFKFIAFCTQNSYFALWNIWINIYFQNLWNQNFFLYGHSFVNTFYRIYSIVYRQYFIKRIEQYIKYFLHRSAGFNQHLIDCLSLTLPLSWW